MSCSTGKGWPAFTAEGGETVAATASIVNGALASVAPEPPVT